MGTNQSSIFLFAALLIGAAAWSAQAVGPAFVQSAFHDNGALDIPTATVAFPMMNTAGSLIVVGVELGATAADRGAIVTDTQGNTYFPATSQLTWLTNGNGASAQVFYAANVKGGSNIVTMTETGGLVGTGNAYNQISVQEYSGIVLTSPLNASAGSIGVTSNTPFAMSSGLATTTTNGALIFGYGNNLSGIPSAGAGFTVRHAVAGISEDRIQTTAGSVAAIATNQSNNDPYVMFMAAFTPAPVNDLTPPSVPTNLSATAVSASKVNLIWYPSTDAAGPVAGYRIFRNGTLVGTTGLTNYQVTGLAPSTAYNFNVAAYDPSGNLSATSAVASATTPADTVPPSIPTGLVATVVSPFQINVSWHASVDADGPVADYVVFRDGISVATNASTVYSNIGLAPSTTYTYRISSFDASGNSSSQSALVSGTTQSSAPASVRLVQLATHNNGAAISNKCVADFPSNNIAGNLIIVAVTLGASAADRQPVITDSRTNTYYPATSQLSWIPQASSQLFYATNVKSGSNTVTMTLANGGGPVAFNSMAIHEYSGLLQASVLDVTATGMGLTTSNSYHITTGQATTTTDGELVFGYGISVNGVLTQGLGFTNRQTSIGLSEDLIQTTAGPIAATAIVQANNDSYAILMATFKPEPVTLLVVTADDQARGYGGTNATLTGTLDGVLAGDNITATYTTAADTNSPVGTYSIVPLLQDPDDKLSHYFVITNAGTLTVTQAVLTATADNQSRFYGATNPPFTVSYSGFVNGENAGVLSGSPLLNTTATSNSLGGDYPITIGQNTLDATNYAFSFVPGTLTVVVVKPVISSVVGVDGTNIAMTWTTIEGVMYRVQYKTNLMDPVWADLPPNIPATGPSISVTNPTGGIPQRFYRVVIVP